MQPQLHEMDSASLNAAFIANYRGFAARLGELPGATVHQQLGVVWVDAGIPLAVFNGVTQADLAEAESDAAIAEVVAHLGARGLPFHWSVGPMPQRDVEARLLAHGLTFDEREPAMAADLDALPDAPPAIADFTIVPVTTEAQVGQWVQTWGGKNTPAEVVDYWRAVYTGLWQRVPTEEFVLYLGMLGDEPVGTVYLYQHAGVAAVHYVVTLPEYRRRGIGAALTWHAMHAARAMGYHVAVLTASPDGIGIYRRLGFREFGTVSTYAWQPA